MGTSEEGSVFGKIAFKKGFITKEDLRKGIRRQKEHSREGSPKPSLKEILLEMGFVTEKQAEEIEEIRQQVDQQNEISGYEFHEKLGEGATGAVYKATQLNLGRPVAIKVLYPSVIEDETYLDRFDREVRSVAKMNHENIIRAHDVGEENGVHYFVMEYVEGETLADRLEEGAMSEQEAVHIGLQMARALAHATEHGLIHRDVKPENIMLDTEGKAKLCDLGLAKTASSKGSTVTQEKTVIGTPEYMSPEQAAGDDLDIRTDIYSLGASLYHALTGVFPFIAKDAASMMRKQITEELVPPIERNPEVSARTSAMIEKMMEKHPEDRYQHPEELIEDFERIREGKDPKHTTVHRSEDRKKLFGGSYKRRGQREGSGILNHWKAAMAGGGSLLLLMGLVLYGLSPSGPPGDQRESRSEDVVQQENPQQPEEETEEKGLAEGTNSAQEGVQHENREQSGSGEGPDAEKTVSGVSGTGEADEGAVSVNSSQRVSKQHREAFDHLKEQAERIESDVENMKKLYKKFASLIDQVEVTQFKRRIRTFRNDFLEEQAKHYYKEKITPEVTSASSLAEVVNAYELLKEFPGLFKGTATWKKINTHKKKLKKQISSSLGKMGRRLTEKVKARSFQEAEQMVQNVNELELDETVPAHAEWQQARERYVAARSRSERVMLKESEHLLAQFRQNFRSHYQLANKSVLEASSKRANRMIEYYLEKVTVDTIRNEIDAYRADVKTLKLFQKTLKEKLLLRMEEGKPLDIQDVSGKVVGIGKGELLLKNDGNRVKVPLAELDIQKRIALARQGEPSLSDSKRVAFGLVSYLSGDLGRAKKWFGKVSNKEETRAGYYLEKIRRWRMSPEQRTVYDLIASLKRAERAELRFAMGSILFEVTGYEGTDVYKKNQSLITRLRGGLLYDPEAYGRMNPWMDWMRRVEITVNADQVEGNLTEFPVYVDLSMMPDSFFEHVNSAEELRVTAGDKRRQLPREVVSLDPSAERGELHFRANQLNKSSDTTFFLYYDNPTGPGKPDPAYQASKVWTNNYVMVQHLNERSGTGTARDSADGFDASVNGATQEADGQLGYAYRFDGKDDTVDTGQDASDLGVGGKAPKTVSVWVNTEKFQRGMGVYEMGTRHDGGGRTFALHTKKNVNKWMAAFWHAQRGIEFKFDSLKRWGQIKVSWDGKTTRVFANGDEVGSKRNRLNTGDQITFKLGDISWQNKNLNFKPAFFDGRIDEWRLSDTARSPAWIETEFHNQNSPTKFLTIRSEQRKSKETK